MAAQTHMHSEEAALSLTLAVVASSPRPLVLLDGDFNIVVASASFIDAFGVGPAIASGQPLSTLGKGEWGVPQLTSILDAAAGAAKIEVHEMDLQRPGRPPRRLVIHAQRLAYLDMEHPRLLMAVCDVTDARADQKLKEETLEQNVVLLREVRHRVANSLQIIASVLLQNAKRTPSEETRGHLKDAHDRVMSVASLERHLADSEDEEVDLTAYFTTLCESIAASIIGDADKVSLVVTGVGGTVKARMSVSLGLIVTELVINALKHAFPDNRPGRITVDCEFRGPNWVLSVTDNGVGMPGDRADIHAGLGSSIIQALAKQLSATVDVERRSPGTRVGIAHTQIALVDEDTGAATAIRRPAV